MRGIISELLFYITSKHCNFQHCSLVVLYDSMSLDIIYNVFVTAYRLQSSHDGDHGAHDASNGSDGFGGRASEWCNAAAGLDGACA